jgi:hypothetical protein
MSAEDAVREYRRACEWHLDGRIPLTRVMKRADAAIAALSAERDSLRDDRLTLTGKLAEAMRGTITSQANIIMRDAERIAELEAKLAAAERELHEVYLWAAGLSISHPHLVPVRFLEGKSDQPAETKRAEEAEAKLRDRTGPLNDSQCDRCQLAASVRADKAQADLAAMTSESGRRANEASGLREEARKGEWCLDTALREREVEVDTRTDSEMKADILARYQPADRGVTIDTTDLTGD